MKVLFFGLVALSILAAPAFAADDSGSKCEKVGDSFICPDGTSYLIRGDEKAAPPPASQATTQAAAVDPASPHVVDSRQRCRSSYYGSQDCWVEQKICWEPAPGYSHCEWRGPNAYAVGPAWNYTSDGVSITAGFISGPSYYYNRPYHYSFHWHRHH